MNQIRSDQLVLFTQRYTDAWKNDFGHAPKSAELYGMPSPCITDTRDLSVFWMPVLSEQHTLEVVEEVVNITIHPSAHSFYGTQYAGDMIGSLNQLSLSLIQIWNDDDFSCLEKNLIAHLMMQKKLKRRPSIFIASTKNQNEIITIDNQSGAIVLEELIENKTKTLANNLDVFLINLKPIAQSLLSGV